MWTKRARAGKIVAIWENNVMLFPLLNTRRSLTLAGSCCSIRTYSYWLETLFCWKGYSQVLSRILLTRHLRPLYRLHPGTTSEKFKCVALQTKLNKKKTLSVTCILTTKSLTTAGANGDDDDNDKEERKKEEGGV